VLAGWQTYTGTIHSFLDYVYRGILAAVRTLDCNVMIGCGVGTSYRGTSYTALPVPLPDVDFVPVGPWNTDGLIICAPLFFDQGMVYFERLIDAGFPIVFAGDHEMGPSVVVDNEGGILQAVDHLVGHGHRQIAFIAGHDSQGGDSEFRLRGYMTGLQKHGIPYDPDLVLHGFHRQDAGYHAMTEILKRNKPVTAVIASNDESAVGVMDALRDTGLVVPHDVAVIGFDNRLESRAQIPLLTTVHHPMFELGYQSAELLYNIIEGKSPRDALIRIPTHLVVRESCGCLPGAGSQNRLEVERIVTPVSPADSFGVPLSFSTEYWALSDGQAAKSSLLQQVPLQKARSISLATQVARNMTEKVYREMQALSHREVEYLCSRLVEAFKLSLAQGDATVFRLAIQQILEHVAAAGDDLFPFQEAITVINESAGNLLASSPNALPAAEVNNMLHQARIAVSEVSRGQFSRLQMRQTETTNQIGLMTSRFLTAENKQTIFEIFNQCLASLGIQGASVSFYEPEPDNPAAWSVLKYPLTSPLIQQRFPTRQFPPPGLYTAAYPFQLAVLPLIGQEGMIGFAAFDTDVLEPLGVIVRQLVAALHGVRLHQEAVAARKLAEEANTLKSRFLSMVSHELRTPLNMIIGLSNMMLEGGEQLSEQDFSVNRKDLLRINIGAQHLESLIRDVLDLARSDVGQLNLVFEPVSLGEILQAVSVIGEQLARDKDLDWRFDLPTQLPPVRGDRTRLRQVVLNLVANAVKFTSRGSVTLSGQRRNGCVIVSVSDTGLGIPLEEQHAIFDEFRQSKRTATRGFGGLGLGLAICKRLIELHGGEIGVVSSGDEGAGSTFYFTIPEVALPEPLPGAVTDSTQDQRILLLVKEPSSGERLQSYLVCQGFQVDVHTVDHSGDWTNWIKPGYPDKLVLDLGITSERGWEILKSIKENPGTRDIPVLFYSLESDQDSGAFLDLNILTKPINTAELAEELVAQGLVNEEGAGSPVRSILIADDDPDIRELHTRILESMASGCRILQAQDGRQALEMARKEHPALILLDLMMPEMDGFTVLETMQSDDSLRGIPTIVVTSQVLTEEDMARLNCGVVSVLNKGMFSASETLEHVTAALSRRHRPGTEAQRLVFKAMTYIHTNYRENISRCDIASHVGVSERHLARCFQQEVGLAPITYLNRFRVKVAKLLLDTGRMSITNVAMEVGFSTGGYFTRVFRDEEGISPREYIQGKHST
jgi:signal transduction histidine kinase/DNA-binding response OmpR family regulator